MNYKAFGKTDIGQIRRQNEDNLLMVKLTSESSSNLQLEGDSEIGAYFLVVDGMGGAIGGELASSTIVNKSIQYVHDNYKKKPNDLLEETLLESNKNCRQIVLKNPEMDGMGAVATGCLFFQSKLHVAQIGDTRLYLLREGKLVQHTEDQNYTTEYLKKGLITLDQVKTFPYKHIVTQAIGPQDKIAPVMSEFEVISKDRILLCSDGLHGMLEDEALKSILESFPDTKEAVDNLVHQANEFGGRDNITVILIDVL